METRAHHVLIGAFTLMVVMAGFAFVFWMGKLEWDRSYYYYDIVFDEGVAGLNQSAEVRYQGILVGEVRAIGVDQATQNVVVTVRVSARDDIRISDQTRASLEFQGLTGLSYIELQHDTSMDGTGEPLPRVTSITGARPVIASQSSSIQALFASVPAAIDTAKRLMEDLRTLLNPQTRADIQNIAGHLETVTRAVAAREAEIDSTMRSIAELTESSAATAREIELLARDLRQATQNLNALLSGETAATIETLNDTAASIGDLARRAEMVVRDNEDAINTFTTQGLAQLGPFVSETRQLVTSLDRLARQLEANPSGFLFGDSRPEEIEIEQ